MLLLRHSARLRTPTAVASRPMSILGAIFGIGEFEGARDQSLGASTSKQQAYDIAVLEYVSMNAHPKHMLQQVLEDDHKFIMGHVLVGASQCLTPLVHQDSLEAAAALKVAAKIALTDSNATAAEKLHVAALDAMVGGRLREAAAIYESILVTEHHDLLALRCSYDLYLLLGDYKNALSTVTRRLPSWSPNDRGYSHLLSMQAYGLQVSGKLDVAENIAEKALSMHGNDRWAFHTMLHIWEARGNANHGASYALQYKDAFDNGGPLERHLYFQWALYLLELGRYDRIEKFLEVYIFQPRMTEAHSVRTLCDATQLFWRLQFADQDTSELRTQLFESWKEVDLENAETPVACSPLAIALKHSIMASMGEANAPVTKITRERGLDLVKLEQQLGIKPMQFSFSRSSDELESVFNGVCEAFTAYAQGQHERAAGLLLPIRGNLSVLGGTSVELDVFELLLIECASHCKDLTLARLLLNERLSDRPQSAQCWSTYSRVFESLGDANAVRDAQNMSYVLGLGQGGNNTN